MKTVRGWDLEDGDAQAMAGVADATYDFVHSSHCLEHMRDIREALRQWIRIVKPGGYLVITVPDEDLYEQGSWPSKFNSDHKWSFTIHKNRSPMTRSVNVLDLVADFSYAVEVERIVLLRDFYRDELAGKLDQTLTPVAECAIEFILRKRRVPDESSARRLSARLVIDNLDVVRDVALQGSTPELPHGVVIPFATYTPWRAHQQFSAAYDAARANTLVDHYRAWSLWQMVEQTRSLAGDILEVGVWRGGTALVIASAVRSSGITCRLFLADTFSGVVKACKSDSSYSDGEHADTSVEMVQELFKSNDVENYEILQGIFPDQTGAAIDAVRLRMVHVDVDIYQSAKDVFAWAWPRLVTGGVMVFDDYGFMRCVGITRLGNELADRSDGVFVHNLNGQAVIVKIRDDHVAAPVEDSAMHPLRP
ncbi:MAG: methyltransferase domain-containing protein [Rhodocyclaceae bacterium]|nr:MAG: methyltransferase domain-containing protein [Rhodocyclaceae bacterium]